MTGAAQIDFVEFPARSVAALQQAVAFYRQAFGWQYQQWGEDYADTRDSGVGSGLNADAAHRGLAPLVVLHTVDLEQARQSVLAAGGVLVRDIFAFPGGRRFHFTDPASNELAVWSADVEKG